MLSSSIARRTLRPVVSRAAFLLVGSFLASLSAFAQGDVLPTVPNPPAIAPPPQPQALPFVGKPNPEDERRRRPLQVAAVLDGATDVPLVELQDRSLPVLRLPGDPRFGEPLTWVGFWLEFRFHPSKAGTPVRATWTMGKSAFFNGAFPAAETTGTIGANGIWRVPINFDPADHSAQLVVNCQGTETRLYLRRWTNRSH